VTFELAFVVLFAMATVVAIAARHFRVPYTVALVLAGLGVNATHAFPAPHLTRDLLFAVILPGLIFEASFHLEAREFWKNKRAIHALAVPGLAASVAICALLLVPVANGLHFVEGFRFVDALVFAALIAATDPIAVVGLFKELGAPKRLAVLVEGESLFNDGTGVALFTIVLAGASGGDISVAGSIVAFVKIAGGGALVGAAIGWCISQVILKVDDAMVEITLTVVCAYGSFVAAEHFHFSGVVATVVAGMLCGNYGRRLGMSPTTRVAVETFWEYWAFALNSVVFLLIGLEVDLSKLLASWKAVVAAFVVVLAARGLVVYAVSLLLRRGAERIPPRWSLVLTWSGLRGALSMVLVLGLPKDFAHRDLLVNMTFGVVVLSILLQGTTMAPLLRRLGIVGKSDEQRRRIELARGRLGAARAALEELKRIERRAALPPDTYEGLERTYGDRVRGAEEELRSLAASARDVHDEDAWRAWRRAVEAEKAALAQLVHDGTIGREAYEALVADANARLEQRPGEAQSESAAPTAP